MKKLILIAVLFLVGCAGQTERSKEFEDAEVSAMPVEEFVWHDEPWIDGNFKYVPVSECVAEVYLYPFHPMPHPLFYKQNPACQD